MEGNAAASYCALLALVVLMGLAGVVMQLAEGRRRRGESAKGCGAKGCGAKGCAQTGDGKDAADCGSDVENER